MSLNLGHEKGARWAPLCEECGGIDQKLIVVFRTPPDTLLLPRPEGLLM